MSILAWECIVSPTLVPSTRELRAFDGWQCSPIGILPNLPIELGGKIVLITVTVMPNLVDYNILLRRDYIYAMQAMVSLLFLVSTFPQEECIITIDQLSYHDPPFTNFT